MTALVTAEYLVSGLAASIGEGVDANNPGDNKLLKDAMMAKNFFTGSSSGSAGVGSFNTRTGAVTLTAADVSSVYPIKTINGQTLIGAGDITISSSGGGGTPTGLTAGSTSTGFINYSGTSKTAGQWYSSTTMPTGTARLNFDGVLTGNRSASNTFFEVVDPDVATLLLISSYQSDPVATSAHNGVFNYYVGTKHAHIGAYGTGTKLSLIAGGPGSAGAVFRAATISESQFEIAVPTLIGYTSSQSSTYRLQVNSQIFATSSTIATSDERYKANVASLTGALTLINKLNPVQFDWIKHPVHNFPEGKTLGFIAQEVAEVLSETDYVNSVVKANNCELPDGTSEEFLGIAEGNLVALLTAAVKELTGQVQVLTAKVQQMEMGTL